MSENARPNLPTQKPVLAVAGIAINDSNQVLMVQRAQEPAKGLWAFPGGKLEHGETLVTGLTREFKEETNLEISQPEWLRAIEKISPPYHYVIMLYAVKNVGGNIKAGDDAAACKWVDIKDIGSLALADGIQDIIQSVELTP